MPPLISPATRQESAAIASLLRETSSGFDVGQELERAYARLWVARAQATSEVIGCLLAWDVADEVHLLDLVVAARERRRGVGSTLVHTLLNHARARATRLVLLEVRRSNLAAQRLYESVGFRVSGERRGYYSDGEDALEMRVEFATC